MSFRSLSAFTLLALMLSLSCEAQGQLLTRTTDLCFSYVFSFTRDARVYAVATNGNVVEVSDNSVFETARLNNSAGEDFTGIAKCRMLGFDTLLCITNSGSVLLFNAEYQEIPRTWVLSEVITRDVAVLSSNTWLVVDNTGICMAFNPRTNTWAPQPVCRNATAISSSGSTAVVATSDHQILRVSEELNATSLNIDTVEVDARGEITAMEFQKGEKYLYFSTRDSSQTMLQGTSLTSPNVDVLSLPVDGAILLYRQSDSVLACVGKEVLIYRRDTLVSKVNTDTAPTVELFSPMYMCFLNGCAFVVGDNSLLMNVKQNGSWNVLSYLPRRPLNSYTHLSDIGQHLITRHSYHSQPIRMGTNEYEWRPLDVKGSCSYKGSVVGQEVSPNGSLVSVFSGFPSWTTSIAPGEYSTDCVQSDFAPDDWSYVSSDTAIGYSSLNERILRSLDGGRSWRSIGPLAANGVKILGSVADTVVLFYANNAGLDTNVYKTSRSLTYARLVGGAIVYDSIAEDLAEIRSFHTYGGLHYAVLRSNLKSEGNLRIFCRVSLSPWKCDELFRVDSLSIGDFDFMDSTVVFTSTRGRIATFDLRDRQSLTTIKILESESSFSTFIRFIRDSVAIVSVGGTTFPGLQRIEFMQKPTPVDVDDAYAGLLIAAVRAIEPNPTNDLSTATIVVASGWDLNDVHVTMTSTLGGIVDTFTLPTRLLSSNSAGEHRVQLLTKGLNSGVYVLNVRTSRSSQSKTLIVLH